MKKVPFVTREKLEEIIREVPTPFHIYDEAGIRKNCEAIKKAFAWNPGYKEYYAVKACPNPFLIDIMREYGCGCDCSSLTELMLSQAMGAVGDDIMFSSNDTPAEEFQYARKVNASVRAAYPVRSKADCSPPEPLRCLPDEPRLRPGHHALTPVQAGDGR